MKCRFCNRNRGRMRGAVCSMCNAEKMSTIQCDDGEHERVQVARSKHFKAKRGLFSLIPFPANMVVCMFGGFILHEPPSTTTWSFQLKKKPAKYIDGNPWRLKTAIRNGDTNFVRGNAQFCNRSATPNCALVRYNGVVRLKSLKAINAFEELTIVYNRRLI